MKRVLYIVQGDAGSYEDHETWNVAAYTSREMAEKHVSLAREWHQSHGWKKENPYDPDRRAMQFDAEWSVDEVPALDSVSEMGVSA